MNRRYQSRVCELLDAGARHRLLAILSRPLGESRSLWDQVKREPKRFNGATTDEEKTRFGL